MPVPRISKEDLKQRLDGDTSPVLVDARLKYPYEHSTVRLPGAIRYNGDGPAPSAPGQFEFGGLGSRGAGRSDYAVRRFA